MEYPERVGAGERAPSPELSCDDLPDYEQILCNTCQCLEQAGELGTEVLHDYPLILFGLGTALCHYETQSWTLQDISFSRGEAGIPINGFIQIGDFDRMLQQIEARIQPGYRCIKLKIGVINFEEELALLEYIHAHYSAREIELRVDADGALPPADTTGKLNRLAELELRSIEQPIHVGQWKKMARLTTDTLLPITLDEELVGCNTPGGKQDLLTFVRP